MKTLILTLLFVMPYITIAQTSVFTEAESYHNRNCLGGTGFCSGATIIGSNEKTTASVQKMSSSSLQVTLDKSGFTAKEWEDIVTTKIFPIDSETSVKIEAKTLEQLGINPIYTVIKPNNYTVTINRDTAVFVLELVAE